MGWFWMTNRQRIKKLHADFAFAWEQLNLRLDRLENLTNSGHSKIKGAIVATQQELTQQVNDLSVQLTKVFGEITKKIADLETALANQSNVTPELQSAFDSLKAIGQTLDDVVPDPVA